MFCQTMNQCIDDGTHSLAIGPRCQVKKMTMILFITVRDPLQSRNIIHSIMIQQLER